MQFDFDTVVERRGTNSLKYDFAKERGKDENVLPLWVADMDFRTAPSIVKKLEETARHGIFGYSEGKEEYYRAVEAWYQTYFDWQIKEEWLIKTPGVVFAIAAAIRAFTKEGDAVLLQQPVYYPFGATIRKNKRRLINNPLQLVDGHYEIDFADFERKILENDVKVFLLCSPHNPVGRVFKEWELRKLGDICIRHGVLVISDEIHSDFTYPGYKHHVFASLASEYADISVTCTSPSKTFNLAGLQVSNIFIPNPGLRREFQNEIDAIGYSQVNLMGLKACQEAYESGAKWLTEVKEYLAGNLAYVRTYLQENLPQIKLLEPEGTYLVWLDFRGLSLNEEEREELLVKKAHLWLDSGILFGTEGNGFERINIACPRKILEQALEQLKEAVIESGY